jgi:hypothetical protein
MGEIGRKSYSSMAHDGRSGIPLDAATMASRSILEAKCIWPSPVVLSGVDFVRKPVPILERRHPAAVLRKGVGPRGRVLAAGVVVASLFFGSAGAVTSVPFSDGILQKPWGSISNAAEQPSHMLSKSSMNKHLPLQDVLQIRGGDLEEAIEESSTVPPLEFAHGTTTVSFVFQGGIIAAVDSRASLGSFVGSKTTQKVLPVNSHILGTMAGGAADCMFWIRKLKSQAMLHELTEGCRMTVARASRLLSNALYQNRGLGLSVGTMIMGFDEDGPPRIYYVDNTGVRIKGTTSCSSGRRRSSRRRVTTACHFQETIDDSPRGSRGDAPGTKQRFFAPAGSHAGPKSRYLKPSQLHPRPFKNGDGTRNRILLYIRQLKLSFNSFFLYIIL